MTQTDALVAELQTAIMDLSICNRIPSMRAVTAALVELERRALRIGELRRFCSAAAHDYGRLLDALSASLPDTVMHHFNATAKELRETSEFMKLAAEGRADGTIYDDELSTTKTQRDDFKARALAAEAALQAATAQARAGALEEAEKVADRFAANNLNSAPLTPYIEGRGHAGQAIATAIRSLSPTVKGEDDSRPRSGSGKIQEAVEQD